MLCEYNPTVLFYCPVMLDLVVFSQPWLLSVFFAMLCCLFSSGITRLNVYAGLAGFYFVRDTYDTGLKERSLETPGISNMRWRLPFKTVFSRTMANFSGRPFLVTQATTISSLVGA